MNYVVAVFFVWVQANAPIGVRSLGTFPDRAACVAYVRPLLLQVAGSSAVRIGGYCPSAGELALGQYGEPVR